MRHVIRAGTASGRKRARVGLGCGAIRPRLCMKRVASSVGLVIISAGDDARGSELNWRAGSGRGGTQARRDRGESVCVMFTLCPPGTDRRHLLLEDGHYLDIHQLCHGSPLRFARTHTSDLHAPSVARGSSEPQYAVA